MIVIHILLSILLSQLPPTPPPPGPDASGLSEVRVVSYLMGRGLNDIHDDIPRLIILSVSLTVVLKRKRQRRAAIHTYTRLLSVISSRVY